MPELHLMTPEDARRYAAEVLRFFPPEEETVCQEIGDGNINYVFRVRPASGGRSLVIKQADRLLRSSGRPLDVGRSRIEAEALRIEAALAPGFVPEVYHFDEARAAIAMEDISAYKSLRRELAEGRVYGHLAENLSTFLVRTLLPTTDLVLDRRTKKERARFFVNPELCDISEDLVFTEPYWDYKGRNVLFPGNEAFVESLLYRDEALHAEVGKLRDRFMNNAQALLHGDLHTGSIFANGDGVKIIDPEFAFYGPMGYDIGNVIGNLFFAWAYHVFAPGGSASARAALERTVRDLCGATAEKLERAYDALVAFPLYRAAPFRRAWLDGVMADAYGYAGTEIVRRVVGDAKVAEITAVVDPERRIPMERALLTLGVRLIKDRASGLTGGAAAALFRRILAGEEADHGANGSGYAVPAAVRERRLV